MSTGARVSGCQDPASTSPLGSTGNVGGAVAHGVLLTLPAYSHFGRPHTPLRGLVVLAVSVKPGVVSSRLFTHAFAWARCSHGIRHARRGLFAALLTRLCVGSLFSRYPLSLAWSLRGSSHTPLRGLVVLAVSVTPSVVSSRLISHAFAWARCSHGIRHAVVVSSRLFSHVFAWACCSRGIRHARHGLFAALLTRLCMGSLFSRYPSRPAWSLRGSSDTPLRGLVVLGSGGHSAGHGDSEVGLWREIICNFNQLRVTLQAICAPPAVPPPWGSHLSQTRQTEETKVIAVKKFCARKQKASKRSK